MDIKLSLIEGDSPNSSKTFENRIFATDFLDPAELGDTPKTPAYQPFFATDVEMSKYNGILEQTAFFKFSKVDTPVEGIGKYVLGVNEDRFAAFSGLFISEFYQRYFQHVVGDLQTRLNDRYSWLNNLETGIIRKMETLLGSDIISIQQKCLEEVEELEVKLSRSSVGTQYEDNKSQRKIFLKLKVCLGRNLGNQTFDNLQNIVQDVRADHAVLGRLKDIFHAFKGPLKDAKRGFLASAQRLKYKEPLSKSYIDDVFAFIGKASPKPLEKLNNSLEMCFETSKIFNTANRDLLLMLKDSINLIAKVKHEFNKEAEQLSTHLMISLISENLEKIKKCQKKAQKAFQDDLVELKNALKDKIQSVNMMIRKKSRQLESEDAQATDPELMGYVELKRKYEQKIQYEEYLYTNRAILTFKSQFKLLKRTLGSLPVLDDGVDEVLEKIVKDFEWEISNLTNFRGLDTHDALVYNYTYKQFETIKSMFETFYDEKELQELYQKLCLSHAQVRYFTQIIDYYYALNSKVRCSSKKTMQETPLKVKLLSHINRGLKQASSLANKIDETRYLDILKLGVRSNELFYTLNWLQPIKIDKCCSFEQKTDFSKYANRTTIYRSELFKIVNKKLLKRKGLKSSWLTTDASRIDLEGQVIDLLSFALSPQFWSLGGLPDEVMRFELARSMNSRGDGLSEPDVVYVNNNMPKLSYYRKVVKHLALSIFKLRKNSPKELVKAK